jgi:hypothetical protein
LCCVCNRGIKASMGDRQLAKPLLGSDMVEVRVDSSATELKEITSKIYAGGICCPSEVPLIHRILTPMPGVLKVRLVAFLSLFRKFTLLKGSECCQRCGATSRTFLQEHIPFKRKK